MDKIYTEEGDSWMKSKRTDRKTLRGYLDIDVSWLLFI